jgi:putative ABC transport system permease protein
MWLLTIRDLQFRATRVVLVSVLVALVATLLFLMTGLVSYLNHEPYRTMTALGAETWVVAEGASGPFTAVSVLPLAEVDAIAPRGASPIVVSRATMTWGAHEREGVFVLGHRPGQLGQPTLSSGRHVTGPGEVVIDEDAGTKIGELVMVNDLSATVVGLAHDASVLAGVPIVFTELGDAQDITFHSRDNVSAVLSAERFEDVPPGAVALTARQVADDALEPLDAAIASVDVVRALLWIVAGIVVGGVVYLTALERSRDFSVLKAVGATDRGLGFGLVVQALVIALAGISFAAILQRLVRPLFPLPVDVPSAAYWRLPLVAALIAVVAGMVGTRQITRTDPAAAFGGPAS